MEEIEVPTEHLQDAINEKAKEDRTWSMDVAISTAFMAVSISRILSSIFVFLSEGFIREAYLARKQ